MKKLSKLSVLLVATGFFTVAGSSATANVDNNYRIRVLQDCKLVAEYAMTQEQIYAYQELQKIEGTMAALELPIKAIEQQIQVYSNKIEQLSALAIQETDTTLHIDKTYLKQQDAVAKQLQKLIASHQADFDAIGQQGEKISAVAHKFEKAMAVTIDGLEHDQIEILSPEKLTSSHYCHQQM